MTTERTIRRWIRALTAGVALAGFVSLCHAQPVITLSNDFSESPAFYDAGSPNNPGGTISNWWQSTGGPNGGGCIGYYIDGAIDQDIYPGFNASFNAAQYYQVTVQLMVASGSGTVGTGGSGGYGHLQLGFEDTVYNFIGVGYQTIFPPAANNWVTYSYAVPGGFTNPVAHLVLLLQGGTNYSGPLTMYIGNVTILPVPNPLLLDAFTNSAEVTWNNYGLAANWDGTVDSPYVNPVTMSAPVNITPPGSIQFSQSPPLSYQGGQLNIGFNPLQYQSVAFDLYYDGPTPATNDYGGVQVSIASNVGPNYPWVFIGAINFNASMIGQWTHFNFPCAATGVPSANGFAFQATPGSGPGTNAAITWHIDNIQLWNPTTHPLITGLTPGTLAGVQMTLDGNGTANLYDQEGITSPSSTNGVTDFFWINQSPATYSFTLTNFPAPLAAPQFDAHIYLCNGDTISDFGYNQTYSGAPYNVLDYLGLRVQNGTNGGVVAMVEWKTNLPNANAFTNISFQFPSMASANGTWSLNFTDNTHGSIVAADGSVNSFVLPDFANDPNYTKNFNPVTSMVQFGIFKNGNVTNDNQTATVTSVLVTNSLGSLLNDGFPGPGLTANYAWQVAEYYQFAADRAIWQPSGTAYWIHWNTTTSGWTVQSSSNILSDWTGAGVTYTYTDPVTGTNTLGAIPAASLPAGNDGFFRLIK